MDRPSPSVHWFPRLVFWETTTACNLACIHCRRLETGLEESKRDLTTEEAYRLIEAIAEVSARRRREKGPTILVFSGGEPLVRRDILDLAKRATEVGLVASLATNGTLVDPERAAQIGASGIRRVAISIDGVDESTHDAFRRQPGSLRRALEGYRNLKECGMSLQINCTITRHNVNQREQLFDLALDLEADALHLFMLVPVGCGARIAETNMLSAAQYEEVLRWFYRRSRQTQLHVKATCAPHYYRVIREEARKEGRAITPQTDGMEAMTKGCLAGTGVCFVSHEGRVFPCGYLPVSCGEVRRDAFGAIWDGSPVFAMLRDDSLLTGKCGACEYRRVCMGCRARAYAGSGNFMDEEPYCAYRPRGLQPSPCEHPWG